MHHLKLKVPRLNIRKFDRAQPYPQCKQINLDFSPILTAIKTAYIRHLPVGLIDSVAGVERDRLRIIIQTQSSVAIMGGRCLLEKVAKTEMIMKLRLQNQIPPNLEMEEEIIEDSRLFASYLCKNSILLIIKYPNLFKKKNRM